MDNTNIDSKGSSNSSSQTDPQLNSIFNLGFFKRVGASLWVKVPLIVASLVVCIASVFNDGVFAYLFAVPMLAILYLALSLPKSRKAMIVASLFVIICVMGENIGTFQFVYPVIGQKVEFIKDVNVIKYDDQPNVLRYDPGPMMKEIEPRLTQMQFDMPHGAPVVQKGIIEHGNVGYVTRIARGGEWDTSPEYVIAVGGMELRILRIHNPSIDKIYAAASFCAMVKWDFCNDTPSDPMNPQIRKLTYLVYFWIPVFFFGILFEA